MLPVLGFGGRFYFDLPGFPGVFLGGLRFLVRALFLFRRHLTTWLLPYLLNGVTLPVYYTPVALERREPFRKIYPDLFPEWPDSVHRLFSDDFIIVSGAEPSLRNPIASLRFGELLNQVTMLMPRRKIIQLPGEPVPTLLIKRWSLEAVTANQNHLTSTRLRFLLGRFQ